MASRGSRLPPKAGNVAPRIRAKREKEEKEMENDQPAAPAPAAAPSAATPRSIPQNHGDLSAANEDLYSKLVDRDEHIARIEAELRSKSAAFDEAIKNNDNLQKEVKQYAKDIQEQIDLKKESQNSCARLRTEITSNARVKKLEQEVADLKATNEASEAKANEKNRELEKEKERHGTVRRIMEGAHKDVDSLQQALHQRNHEFLQLQSDSRQDHDIVQAIGRQFDQAFKDMNRELNPQSLMSHLHDLQTYANQPRAEPERPKSYRKVSMADELAGHSDNESEYSDTHVDPPSDSKGTQTDESEHSDTHVDPPTDSKDTQTTEDEHSNERVAELEMQLEKVETELVKTKSDLRSRRLHSDERVTELEMQLEKAKIELEKVKIDLEKTKSDLRSRRLHVENDTLRHLRQDLRTMKDGQVADGDARRSAVAARHSAEAAVAETKKLHREAFESLKKRHGEEVDSLKNQLAGFNSRVRTYVTVPREKTTLEWFCDAPHWFQFIISMLFLALVMGVLSTWLERHAWVAANVSAMDHVRGTIGASSVPNTYLMWFEDLIGFDRRLLG